MTDEEIEVEVEPEEKESAETWIADGEFYTPDAMSMFEKLGAIGAAFVAGDLYLLYPDGKFRKAKITDAEYRPKSAAKIEAIK